MHQGRRMEELVQSAIEAHETMGKAQTSVSHLIGKQKFKEIAVSLGIWAPGKRGGSKIPLSEILEGKHQHYESGLLRKRLITEGIKKAKCECCGRKTWMGQKLPLSLHHKDGNHGNNVLENLEILCYNCHAVTDNFGSKNKKM